MKKYVFLTALASALTACGGSSTSSDIVVPGSLQTTLVAPTYAPSSEELAAFNAINSFRNSMGLGYWLQNPLLDQAAANHMTYSLANDPSFMEDLEEIGKVGFTGTTPSQRAINLGYFVLANTTTATNVKTAAVGELYATGPGATVFNSMVNTIYHRSGLLAQSTREIGLKRDTTMGTHWWFNHGRLDSGQYVASNYVATYPTDGLHGVPLSMTPEYPSVYSNQTNFDFATQTSSPVSLTTAAATTLSVTSFTVTKDGSTMPLPGTVWTLKNDPNLLSSNFANAPLSLDNPPDPTPTISPYEAYWVGNAPFLPNETYHVSFTGSTYLIQYGVTKQFTRTWSFTTGS